MLNVFSDDTESPQATHTVSGVYLHGEIENRAGFDCIGYRSFHLPVEPGVHRIIVTIKDEQVPCLLFLWRRGDDLKIDSVAGLIVDPNDSGACAYAAKCYHEQPLHI